MLKKRIIVSLLHDGKSIALKPISFMQPQRPVGSLMQHIKVLASRGIDELALIDINATKQRREPNFELIKEVASHVTCPLTIGGGIHTLAHVRQALNCGADKILLRTAAHRDFIPHAAKFIGSQSIVVAIDSPFKNYSSYPLIRVNAELHQKMGAGEIILTDMFADGTMSGYNLDLLKSINNIKIPVVINGGCSGFVDMGRAFNIGADACMASSIFLFKDITPKECAQELKKLGHNVRV